MGSSATVTAVEAAVAGPFLLSVDAGEFPAVAKNVTEPKMTATKPSATHDHHRRYSGRRCGVARGEGGHCRPIPWNRTPPWLA